MKKMEDINEMVSRHRSCCLLCYILPTEKTHVVSRSVSDRQDEPFKIVLQALSKCLF